MRNGDARFQLFRRLPRLGLGAVIVPALVLSLPVTRPAFAQTVPPAPLPEPRFTFSPHAGMYMPVGKLVDRRDVDNNVIRVHRQVGAALIGARLGMPVHPLVSVEGTVGWTPSVSAVTDQSTTLDSEGGVLLSSVRARLRLSSLQKKAPNWFFYASPGVGLLHRYGSAIDETGGRTNLALTLGVAAELVPRKSRTCCRFEFEDFVSYPRPRDNATTKAARLHHELLISVGFSFAIGER